MNRMSVGEFKARFSEAVELVKDGEEIEVLYGRAKEPVAKLIPVKPNRSNDLIGAFENEGSYYMSDDWKMTQEELINL